MLYEQIGIRNVSNLLIATPIIKTLGVTTFLSYPIQFVCYSVVKAVLLVPKSYPFTS